MSSSEVERLARRRREARASLDFATADRLREEIRVRGYEVIDTPQGFELRKADPSPVAPPAAHSSAEDVPSVLDEPPSFDATVQWVVQGWAEDVARGIQSFRRNAAALAVQHVVVEALDARSALPGDVESLRVRPEAGWAVAMNAGLRRSRGRIVVLADGSVEATGDALSPLLRAMDDPTVGITGPFGIVTNDLREFRASDGPDVDAIEGYLMAFRRELLGEGVRFDEKFRFYRTADIDLSFQVKELGLRAVVTRVPVHRHEHRMWTSTPEDRRSQLSKRNFYRFLDRWRGRTDLLVSERRPG